MEVTSIVDECFEGVGAATTESTVVITSTPAVAGHSSSKLAKNRVPRPKPPIMVQDEQPTAADLAKLGIKVRDFAYEKTDLPPVRTIYRHPRQIQPAVNRNHGVQRQSTETAEDGVFSQPSQESSQPLERTVTEPVLSPPPPPTRQQGFLNIEDHIQADQHISTSPWAPTSPAAVTIPESQTSNEIKTPLIMPNGSWKLDPQISNEPSTAHLAAQATVVDSPIILGLTTTQLIHRSSSQRNLSSSSSRLNILSSPLSSAPPSPGSFSSPLRHNNSISHLQRQTSRMVKPRDFRNHTTIEKPPAARRYNLRKRPVNPSATANPKPSKRMKFAAPEASAQSRNAPKAEGGSSSSRHALSPLKPKRSKRKTK
ncbi:hypothetical protein HYPSUDRAFT_196158 [Hypholoma sublateritium FD-334 SS-4]|uniref:Uncharacterized protein n=1 Tax=Hypholoma sublateritium (strain FD-334 SS-4) TaxID=945553 RepID=A0A0D2PNQ2_HYPSF|nr:hypothetical protein HYPSUDRAFT_196158 [Hypholoma sublateritium FD-334 SS-4]